MFDLIAYIKDLIARKFTGTIKVAFNQGGIAGVEEMTKVK